MTQATATRRAAYSAASYVLASCIESGQVAPLNFDEQCETLDVLRDEILDVLAGMDNVPRYAWTQDSPIIHAARLFIKHAGNGCELSGHLRASRIADAIFTAAAYVFKFTD